MFDIQTHAPEDIDSHAQALWEIKQQIKSLSKLEAELSDILKRAANGQTIITGSFIYMMKMRKGSVKYNEIPELAQVDLEQYRGAEIIYYELNKIS